jgi:DNA repair protein RecO
MKKWCPSPFPTHSYQSPIAATEAPSSPSPSCLPSLPVIASLPKPGPPGGLTRAAAAEGRLLMSSHRANAFVLRSYPFGEADRVVVFFTEEFGLLRGVAKGSRKLKSRIAGALEPLTLVRLMFVDKPGRELAVVTGCEAVRSLYGALEAIPADTPFPSTLDTIGVLGVLAELTSALHADRDPNPAHFRLLELAQQALITGHNPRLVMHYFELFSLKLAGVLKPAESLADPAACELMRSLLRTNLLNDPAPVYGEDALESLGRALRRQVAEAVGRKLNAYRFLDETKTNAKVITNQGR